MHKGTQHIAFSESAGETVRYALNNFEDSAFIHLYDDLGTGPINPYDVEERFHFFAGLCPDDDLFEYANEMKASVERFWEAAAEPYEKKVLWFSRRSVSEYSGLLEFLSRQDDFSRIEVVDLTDGVDNDDSEIFDRKPYRIVDNAVGSMRPEWIFKAHSRSRRIDEEEIRYYLSLWKRLQDENANIRTLWRNQLYSAEDEVYDNLVYSFVPDEWVNVAGVVGESLGKLSDEYNQVGDTYLFSRLFHLIESGKVNVRREREALRFLEVKRNIYRS